METYLRRGEVLRYERHPFLEAIINQIDECKEQMPAPIIVLLGPRGIGKTQVAFSLPFTIYYINEDGEYLIRPNIITPLPPTVLPIIKNTIPQVITNIITSYHDVIMFVDTDLDPIHRVYLREACRLGGLVSVWTTNNIIFDGDGFANPHDRSITPTLLGYVFGRFPPVSADLINGITTHPGLANILTLKSDVSVLDCAHQVIPFFDQIPLSHRFDAAYNHGICYTCGLLTYSYVPIYAFHGQIVTPGLYSWNPQYVLLEDSLFNLALILSVPVRPSHGISNWADKWGRSIPHCVVGASRYSVDRISFNTYLHRLAAELSYWMRCESKDEDDGVGIIGVYANFLSYVNINHNNVSCITANPRTMVCPEFTVVLQYSHDSLCDDMIQELITPQLIFCWDMVNLTKPHYILHPSGKLTRFISYHLESLIILIPRSMYVR